MVVADASEKGITARSVPPSSTRILACKCRNTTAFVMTPTLASFMCAISGNSEVTSERLKESTIRLRMGSVWIMRALSSKFGLNFFSGCVRRTSEKCKGNTTPSTLPFRRTKMAFGVTFRMLTRTTRPRGTSLTRINSFSRTDA